MATLRVHDSTEYWKKIDLMVKPASYPMAAGYDVPSVDTIHRPLTLDLSEVCHEDRVYWAVRRAQDILLSSLALVVLFGILVTATNWGNWLVIAWVWVIAGLCIYRHHANIGRLIHGTERKIGQKA